MRAPNLNEIDHSFRFTCKPNDTQQLLLDECFSHNVSKKVKITNLYNQIPHLTQDIIWERIHQIQEIKEVYPFQAGDYEAARNRQA